MKVLAYDKYRQDYSDAFAEASSFERIQEEAEVLSIHVPLTSETKGFFTLEVLGKFAKPFYLINTARGEVISLSTLNEALERKVLKGAMLDVLENEKLHTLSASQRTSFKELAARPNVLLTPHVAGWTFQSYEKINRVLVNKIRKAFPDQDR